MIRNNHREINIEYIGKDRSERRRKKLKKLCVYINYQMVKLKFVDSYIRFIRDIADVKVERVITKNLWRLPESCHRTLHDSIIFTLIGENDIKALIGLEDICYKCKVCYDIIRRCQEYRPANAYSLSRVKTPRHFNKLIVTDETLCTIANTYTELNGITSNELLKFYVKDFITCDKLVIWVLEVTKFDDYDNKLPRQILELILKEWNVKKVELKFLHNSKYFPFEWSEEGLFTKFQFNDSYDSVVESTMNLKFDEVVVDLSESYYCAKDISYESQESNGYENIIANVRRIFPTDKITIQFSHDYYNKGRAINTTLDRLVRVALKENPRDLRIDIRYFTKMKAFKTHNPITDEIELSIIPSSFYVNSRKLHCSVQESSIHCYRRRLTGDQLNFSNRKWIGKQCKVVSSQRNFILNINIFMKENDKSYEFSEEKIEENPDAFVKHFIRSLRS